MGTAGLADDLVAVGQPTEEDAHALAGALLDRRDPPTAIVCATDRMAVGALRAAVERGLAVGRDVAITGHDNIPASRFTSPALTTMELPMRRVGQRLAEMVLARLRGADARDLAEVHPLVQIPRASSGE
jgi:LacI family transcriptional regulator